MAKKSLVVKAKELQTDVAFVKDLEVSIGKIVDDTWEEPMGPTPFPSMVDLRDWDHKLLQRYKPS